MYMYAPPHGLILDFKLLLAVESYFGGLGACSQKNFHEPNCPQCRKMPSQKIEEMERV